MAPIIGNALLLFNLSIALFCSIFFWKFGKKYLLKDIYKIYFALNIAGFLIAVFTQISLIYSFVISDYNVINVYNNSHHLKPIFYKITASWGNHEGSMLLLITVLCGYNLFFFIFSKIDQQLKISTCSFQQFIIFLFSAYTGFTSNPFLTSNNFPENGLGLNPILQDVGLALHPPMLYIGYLGFAIIFSITLSSLALKKFSTEIIKSLLIHAYFAIATLTLGIALGAWWAYRELGWGGYWFWDPVENISLMPWLSSIALIHTLKYSSSNKSMLSWSYFLIIITMILCLLGIFLTRSGVLTSVHAFAIAVNRGFFIIFLISIIGCLGLYLMAKKGDFTIIETRKLSKENNFIIILLNNYFIITALIVVIIGTIYPLLYRGLFNEFIAIGPSYYNKIFNILLAPLLLVLIASILNKKTIKRFNNILIFIILLTLTISLNYFYPIKNYLILLNLFLALYALILNFYFHKKIIQTLVHGGFLLIIIGIIISSSYNKVLEKNIKINEEFQLANFQIKFTDISYKSDKNFISRIGNFEIFKNQKHLTNLHPELRFYPISNQSTNESSIFHHPFYDLYLVIGTKDENENYAIRAYFKPMINFIWIGVCLILFGFFTKILQVLTKNNRANISQNQ